MDGFFDGFAKLSLGVMLQAILMGLLVGGAAFLARNWVRRGKVWVRGDDGHTCMSPLILLTGLLCAVAAGAFLMLGLLDPQSLRDRGQFICLGQPGRQLLLRFPLYPALLSSRLGMGAEGP